jgi:hypothetical protein
MIMRITKPPFTGATCELLYAMLTGGECIGYQSLLVSSGVATSLIVPIHAVYVVMVVEADPSVSDKSKVMRIKEFDTVNNPPTAIMGIPLGDLTIYEVRGSENLKNFRAIGIEAGKTHLITIQYYG